VHILLVRGKQVMEHLFPGLEAEMVQAGAYLLDSTADVTYLTALGWRRQYRSGLMLLSFSRHLIDWHLHQRLARDPRIRFRERCEVTGLTTTADNAQVTGVKYRFRNSSPSDLPAADTLRADFVVDASGRFSRTPEWLAELGYAPPHETVVDPFMGYASRWYKVPAGWHADWQGVVLATRPPADKRGGVLVPVEGRRWLVTLAGMARDNPPTDEAGFLQFASTLRSSEIYDAIREAEPASPIAGHRSTANCLRHYESMLAWPQGFVTLGDAVCAFNPIYGQGMTAAALAAMTLDTGLREQRRANGDPAGVARRFQKHLAQANRTPWLMATSEDFRWPETEGGRPGLTIRLMHRYMDQVIRAAVRNPAVDREFLKVTHLLAGPAALFHPRVVARVVARAVGRMTEK
jgi:2-polyprenyl-6-methoxyphenol hydroxylase-like FAD-dependent oxidoreductase